MAALGAVFDGDSAGLLGEDERDGLYGQRERRWIGGYQWRPVGCGDARSWAACDDDEGTKSTSEQPDRPLFTPWMVYADDQCDAVGYTLAERQERARINLERKQGNAIGAELWTGTLATAQAWDNPTLAGDATPLSTVGDTASAPGLTFALGVLQEYLADCLGDGEAGVIHATRATINAWYRAGAIYWEIERGVIRDIFGNIVLACGGYDGSDPEGTVTPGFPWAYATGPVAVRLGDIMPVGDQTWQVLNLTTNTETVFMERAVGYAFDRCCVFGVQVNVCCDQCDMTES